MGKYRIKLKEKKRHKIFVLNSLGKKILWVFGFLLFVGLLSMKFTFFKENQSLFLDISSSVISSFIAVAAFKFFLQKITFGKLDKYFVDFRGPGIHFSVPLFFFISFVLFWILFIFVGSWFVFGF
jgi:hypothetical protein